MDKKLLLLFPLIYFLHDLEEILTLEAFLKEFGQILPVKVSASEFTVAFSILWIIATAGCISAYLDRRFLGMKPVTLLAVLIPGLLLANAAGHLLQVIYFKSYVPGVITSVIVLLPYAWITVRFLITKNLMSPKKLLVIFLAGFVLQGPIAFAAHALSKYIWS